MDFVPGTPESEAAAVAVLSAAIAEHTAEFTVEPLPWGGGILVRLPVVQAAALAEVIGVTTGHLWWLGLHFFGVHTDISTCSVESGHSCMVLSDENAVRLAGLLGAPARVESIG